MIGNLQGLRALAAICVMVFHFGLMPATNLPFHIGAFGVDLFFVLSGFIIAHSSAHQPEHFIAHRLIRVIPSYWIITAVAALFTLQAIDGREAIGWLAQSMLLLPGPGGRPALIFVAWTLAYELAFYLIYWLGLRTGGTRAPIASLLVLLVLAWVPLPIGAGPWPLLIEFALGITVYLATERVAIVQHVSGLPGVIVAAVGLAILLIPASVTGYNPDDYESALRVLFWGLPATAVVLGLVVAERGGLALQNRLALLLGAASYAIYLIHPIIVGQLLQVPAQTSPMSWLYCAIASLFTIAVAAAYFKLVEAPMLTRLRHHIDDRRATA